jgi:hypothetical protein
MSTATCHFGDKLFHRTRLIHLNLEGRSVSQREKPKRNDELAGVPDRTRRLAPDHVDLRPI